MIWVVPVLLWIDYSVIDEDLDKIESEREIELDQNDDYIGYLLDAIRYVAGVSDNADNG